MAFRSFARGAISAILLSFLAQIFAASSLAQTGGPATNRHEAARQQERSAQEIRAHMAYLADDLLEGRDAGSRGEQLAALYIAAHFESIGLAPQGDDGTFAQRFPLRSVALDPSSVGVRITNDVGSIAPKLGDDIFLSPHPKRQSIDLQAETVFAGHGIVAPGSGIDDYQGLDVDGKIVVVLGSAPSTMPSAEAAHYSSNAKKYEAAADRGAVGMIRIWTPDDEARFPFARLPSLLETPIMSWVGPDGATIDGSPQIELRMIASVDTAEALFAGSGRRTVALVERGRTASVPGFALNAKVRAQLSMTPPTSLRSQNVAGFLEGSDPDLQDEVVVLTAHYDHVGICGPDGAEDRICNGAIDNALGTATMMSVAQRMAERNGGPRRSVLFLAVGAEERGLLGADYFVNHPTLGDREIVANINMDGGFPFYRFSDVIAFGAEHSTMGELLAEAIAPIGLVVAPDPFPEQGIFTRSDQYAFVQKGVPALFLYNGFTDENGYNAGQAVWDDIMATRYHQPSDDLSQPIDYDVAADFADVFYRLAQNVANAPTRPIWYGDSIFGDLFAPDAGKADRPGSGL